MKKTLSAGVVAAMLAGVGAAQEHEMPRPQKEHEWLRQLVGEWDSEGEIVTGPTTPPLKTRGTESGRMIGGFWALIESKGDFMGQPFTGILTLGYDPTRKKYVGAWFDSVSTYLWKYEGTVDASGKVLTLDTEGPCHEAPGKTARYREVIEVKGKDHKVFTSSREKDGQWYTYLTFNYRRKK